MAKGEQPDFTPRAHISWPSKGIRLSGDHQAIAPNKRVCLVLEGTVKGFSMGEFGCSIELDPDTVRVDHVSNGTQPIGPTLADLLGPRRV